jgi:hypothetical protein
MIVFLQKMVKGIIFRNVRRFEGQGNFPLDAMLSSFGGK